MDFRFNVNGMVNINRIINVSLAFDYMFVFLFALLPILMNYRGLIINASVTVVVVIVPYAVYKILTKRYISVNSFRVLLPLALFWLFKIIDHGTNVIEVSQVFVYIVLLIVFAAGCIKPGLLINVAIKIACLACICIFFQYICYYILGFHLRLAPINYLLDGAQQWSLLAQTGRISVTGREIAFYRPSAFFLEPSHMFMYLFAPLYYELLTPDFGKEEKRIAILLSAGMILSTSGMGIMATAIGWGIFILKSWLKSGRISLNKVFSIHNLVLLSVLLLLLVLSYYNVDFFQRSVNRIFFSGSDYRNAVSSRLEGGTSFILQMQGIEFLIGIADHYAGLDFHMTGFNATMYKYGITGTLLSYFFYFKCVKDLKKQYFWLALVLIGTSFFMPHTHGTFYMLFFVVFFLEGYRERDRQALLQETRV